MRAIILFFILATGIYTQVPVNSIVARHLKMRMNIAKGIYYVDFAALPQAKNMRKLAWDTSLESSALAYASTCPTGPSGATGYGENVKFYWTNTPGSILYGYIENAVISWENDIHNYGLPSLTMDATIAASGSRWATQMAWAKTALVGCGAANCGPDPAEANKTRIAVICHYSPKGNIIGEVIYEQGTTCSNCPTGTTCSVWEGMCE